MNTFLFQRDELAVLAAALDVGAVLGLPERVTAIDPASDSALTALRSLAARGLVQKHAAGIRVQPDLTDAMLRMRQPSLAVLATRRMSDGASAASVYFAAEGLVTNLCFIDEDNFTVRSSLPADDLVTDIAEFVELADYGGSSEVIPVDLATVLAVVRGEDRVVDGNDDGLSWLDGWSSASSVSAWDFDAELSPSEPREFLIVRCTRLSWMIVSSLDGTAVATRIDSGTFRSIMTGTPAY